MNKRALSESDICDKFIRPAMERAGWHGLEQIYREYPLRAGCVVVRGRTSIPPLGEQSRIVARVTELRRLCDDLRQRVAASQATQSRLAEALVESAAE
jgi:type I site-specific restriction endonuclease